MSPNELVSLPLWISPLSFQFLQVLDARSNKISTLEVLSILPSLQDVFLQDNSISSIAPNTFLAKTNLTRVHLERNSLLTLQMTSLMISITTEQSKNLCLNHIKCTLNCTHTQLLDSYIYYNTIQRLSTLSKAQLQWLIPHYTNPRYHIIGSKLETTIFRA